MWGMLKCNMENELSVQWQTRGSVPEIKNSSMVKF